MIQGFPLSLVMLIIVIIFFGIDYGFMSRYDPERGSRKGWSWGYTLFTIGMGLVVILQPWFLPKIGWTTESPFGLTLQLLGGVLVTASIALHIWARRHLRQFYVERVELQDNHRVIQTGPYAYVRHPIFTTFFGLAFGVAFLNPSIITLAVTIYTLWDFTKAAQQEERLLAKSLPDYAVYMERTSRFFPRFIRR